MTLPKSLEAVQARPSMYLLDSSYFSVAACVQGYDLGTNGVFLDGFREWLIPQLDDSNNFSWNMMVAQIANSVANDPAAWSEDENENAVSTLFSLLSRFLTERDQPQGRRNIKNIYDRWLRDQDWYVESSGEAGQ